METSKKSMPPSNLKIIQRSSRVQHHHRHKHHKHHERHEPNERTEHQDRHREHHIHHHHHHHHRKDESQSPYSPYRFQKNKKSVGLGLGSIYEEDSTSKQPKIFRKQSENVGEVSVGIGQFEKLQPKLVIPAVEKVDQSELAQLQRLKQPYVVNSENEKFEEHEIEQLSDVEIQSSLNKLEERSPFYTYQQQQRGFTSVSEPKMQKYTRAGQDEEASSELILLISPKKGGKANSVETLYQNRQIRFGSNQEFAITRARTSEIHPVDDARGQFGGISKTPTQVRLEFQRLFREFSREKQLAKVSKSRPDIVKKEKNDDRPEYASDPREFTKRGSPIPFWQMEMRKGTDYLVHLHRHYGRRKKHERARVYKPDLDAVSVNTADSITTFEHVEDIYHDGLKHLIPLDRIFLFHRVEIQKGIFSWAKTNDYHILNHHGHILYRVVEDISCRKKTFTICDYHGNEIMQLVKTGSKYHIFCPLGSGVGYVVPHRRLPWQPLIISLCDENVTELIQFEKLPQQQCCDKSQDCIFEYQSIRGQGALGIITKKLANLKMSNFSEYDYYGIKINNELSPNIKAIVMAAWFIIYKNYYEGKTYREVHHNLTRAAKQLFDDFKPSTEELPRKLQGGIVYSDRESDQ